MKVSVDHDSCIACFLCLSIAPDVLEEDDSGLPVPIKEDTDESLRDQIEEAADQCPTQSITVE